MTKLAPFFKFFGSKWRTCSILPEPLYETIIEPFAGSAAYSLHHAEKNVILYEENECIYNLWSFLINEATEKDILSVPFSSEVIHLTNNIQDLDLSDGQKLFMKYWQYTNNTSNSWKISTWIGHGGGGLSKTIRERCANQLQYIKHWKLGGRDGMQAFIQNDATYFVDPPYQFLYAKEYHTKPIDYDKLSKSILNVQGQVICCEAINPTTLQAPTYLPFTTYDHKSIRYGADKRSKPTKELIYIK
jgi:site-specific DNA-adenine methylase